MTAALMGYLKSHPATKQEAQLKKIEQSAYVKMPSDSIHQKDIRFSYPEQHFFRQKAAYVQ
jgi:hypothetical protein